MPRAYEYVSDSPNMQSGAAPVVAALTVRPLMSAKPAFVSMAGGEAWTSTRRRVSIECRLLETAVPGVVVHEEARLGWSSGGHAQKESVFRVSLLAVPR
jgi:hypothetical protein